MGKINSALKEYTLLYVSKGSKSFSNTSSSPHTTCSCGGVCTSTPWSPLCLECPTRNICRFKEEWRGLRDTSAGNLRTRSLLFPFPLYLKFPQMSQLGLLENERVPLTRCELEGTSVRQGATDRCTPHPKPHLSRVKVCRNFLMMNKYSFFAILEVIITIKMDK